MEVQKQKIPCGIHYPERKLHVEHYFLGQNIARPTVICLPGGPGAGSDVYHAHVDELLSKVNVILMDPRGCGKSDPCSEVEYDMSCYIEDIEAIRQYFSLSEWCLLGTSYGSMVAQGYAIQYGQYVQGLILVNGAPSGAFIKLAVEQVKLRGNTEQQAVFDDLLAGKIVTAEALKHYFDILWSLYTVNPPPCSNGQSNVNCNPIAATAGLGPQGFLHDFNWLPDLHTVACPTLIIVGKEDWINPLAMAEQMHQAIPYSQLHILEGKHIIWEDQPKQYYPLVKAFLQQLT